jgi:hypothetical protein
MRQQEESMSKQPPTKTPSEIKHYTFNAEEYLYVSERKALVEVYDNLIKRHIMSKVLPRLGISDKKYLIRISSDGQGIDCEPMVETKA